MYFHAYGTNPALLFGYFGRNIIFRLTFSEFMIYYLQLSNAGSPHPFGQDFFKRSAAGGLLGFTTGGWIVPIARRKQ